MGILPRPWPGQTTENPLLKQVTNMLWSVLMITSGLTARAAEGEAAPFIPTPQLYGLLQVWVTAWDFDVDPNADPASYGDPEDDPGFKIRRARLGLTGESDQVRYGLIVGTSSPFDALLDQSSDRVGGDVDIVDASAGVALTKGLWLDAGVQKVPVSRDLLISSGQLALSERAVSSEWLAPGRDVGLLLDGNLGEGDALRGRLRAGAFNGNSALLGDDNAGKLIAARAELGLGPGDTYQTWGKVDGFSLGLAADGYWDEDIATRTVGFGGDAMIRVAGLAVMLEGRAATLAPTQTDIAVPDVLASVMRIGGLAQVGYSLGAFEPAARFSLFDDDTDATDNGDVAEVLVGGTWHGPQDGVRAGLGYVLRMEMGGATTANDTVRLWTQLAL